MDAIPDGQGGTSTQSPRPSLPSRPADRIALLVLVAGCIAIFLPTIIYVANSSWNSDQGGHGPIVLVTGLWLVYRLWPHAVQVAERPPLGRVVPLLAILLPAYMLAKITQIIELEGFLMYGCLLSALYSVVGGATMRRLWFPLVYLGFMFPPPDTLVAIVTVPLKIWLSHFAVAVLKFAGLPVGNAGVSIFIGQYSLLVAAACSGLNSLISLAAISLFYIYMRHQAEWKYAAVLVLLTVPVALLANLVRVLALILITYYGGNAMGEGFLHNFAGILMFTVAVLSMFGVDALLKPVWDRLFRKETSMPQQRFAI